jgi:hypothetical protein
VSFPIMDPVLGNIKVCGTLSQATQPRHCNVRVKGDDRRHPPSPPIHVHSIDREGYSSYTRHATQLQTPLLTATCPGACLLACLCASFLPACLPACLHSS